MKFVDKLGTEFDVRTPAISDFEQIKRICEDRFGKGYITEEEFKKWIKNPDFCKVAVYGETVAGIVYLMPETPEALAKALKLDEEYVKRASNGKKVIHSRCAALDVEFEHRGLTPILHNVIFGNIDKNVYGAIFAPAWTYNGYTPMKKYLEREGFGFIGNKENIWYDMDGYECVICKGRCKCDAAIFEKTIYQEEKKL